MKKLLKYFVIGVIILTLLMGTAIGQTITKTIEVIYNTVNITVNGQKIEADNILYNGVTYVPIRAVSEALGKEAGWDQATMTASINDKTAEKLAEQPAASEWKEIITFEGSSIKDTETFKITGNEWRIVWETSPGEYGDMNFIITTYKADGTINSLDANIIGKGNDTSYKRGSGNYYLSINTAQNYKITIEQK